MRHPGREFPSERGLGHSCNPGREAVPDSSSIAVVFLPPGAIRAPLLADEWFSPSEREQCSQLPVRRRSDWIASRIAVKLACRRAGVRGAPRCSQVAHDSAGRPLVATLRGRHCSLAHAAGAGLAAVSSRPVGVDLERVNRFDRQFTTRIACDEEIALLPVPAALWTIKEAALKASGHGLGIHPRRATLVRRDGGDWLVRVRHGKDPDSIWRASTLLCDGFCLAIARPLDAGAIRLSVPRGGWAVACGEG
jgi:phosphopantetheinyl transferase (holo-ACP synthase)